MSLVILQQSSPSNFRIDVHARLYPQHTRASRARLHDPHEVRTESASSMRGHDAQVRSVPTVRVRVPARETDDFSEDALRIRDAKQEPRRLRLFV